MLTAAHIYFKAEFNSTYGNPNQNCDAAPASTTSKGSILLMSHIAIFLVYKKSKSKQ